MRSAGIAALAALVILAPGVTRAQDANPMEARVADLLENRCARAGCHAGPVPQQGLDLTRANYYAALVGEPSTERPELMRVAPGEPGVSYMMMKLRDTPGIIGVKMPLLGDPLTDEEMQLLVDCVNSIETIDEERKALATRTQAFPFDGWKIINLPTTRPIDGRSFLFGIQHRFNPSVRTGYDSFYGLDGSGVILLSLGYAINDDFLVVLGRSNSAQNVELYGRWLAARQDLQGSWPLDVGVNATVNWVTEQPLDDSSRLRKEAFKFTAQVTLAHEFAERFGAAVVPGILFNPSEDVEGEDPLVTIGLGGRWRFRHNMSLVGEWVPITSGYIRTFTNGNDIRFDSWGAAYEISTGGHVFQIVVSNTVGLTADQYLRGGDLDIREGDMRLGFNIHRVLNFF